MSFYDRADLIDEISKPYAAEICKFSVSGRSFRVLFTYWDELKGGVGQNSDANDVAAFGQGYISFGRIVAVGPDNLPYGVWEFYERPDGKKMSKAIDVDGRQKREGIGTLFAFAARKAWNIEWSGTFTKEGARLKDRVEKMEAEENLKSDL